MIWGEFSHCFRKHPYTSSKPALQFVHTRGTATLDADPEGFPEDFQQQQLQVRDVLL